MWHCCIYWSEFFLIQTCPFCSGLLRIILGVCGNTNLVRLRLGTTPIPILPHPLPALTCFCPSADPRAANLLDLSFPVMAENLILSNICTHFKKKLILIRKMISDLHLLKDLHHLLQHSAALNLCLRPVNVKIPATPTETSDKLYLYSLPISSSQPQLSLVLWCPPPAEAQSLPCCRQ